MARLIDADALLKELAEIKREVNCHLPDIVKLFKGLRDWIKDAPTVDAVPVKHGQWLEDEKTYPGPDLSNYVCSSCKRVGGTWIKGLKPENLFTYCPWCGAKMDGERKDT